MKNESFTVRLLLGSLCVFAMSLPFRASAQTISTWVGGGSDNNWSTTGNWSGAGVPSGDTGNNVVVFSGTNRPTTVNNLVNWTRSFGQMYFASDAASFTLSGDNFGFRPYLGSGTQQIFQNSANTQTIGVGAFSFRNDADSQINLNAGDLVITTPDMYIDSASSVRFMSVTGSDATRRTVTFAGNVNKGGGGADPDMLIKANKRVLVTGSLTFGSGNDGSVFIDDGVLQFSGAGTMTGGRPVIGTTSGSANAAVWLDTAGVTFGQQLEVRNGSSGRRTIGGLNTTGTVTFSGEFVGNAGNYDLAAATGGAAIFSGVRNVNAGVFVNRPEGASTYGGTVVLSGTTNSNEFTAIHAGTLQFSDFNQLGSAHLEFNASSGDSGTLRYAGGSTTTTKTLWIDNTGITRAAIDVSQAGTTLTWNPGNGAVNQNLTKTGAGSLQFGLGISGAATVGVEAGTLILTGSSSYSGGTVVSGGTLEVSAGGSQGGSAAGLGTGTVSITSGAQVKYWLSTGSAITVANPFSLSGGTLHTTDGANTYSGRVTLASGSSTISAQYEDVITLSGGLAGSGNVLFTQSGGTGGWAAPTYVLSGTGANTGTVRVSGSSGGGATKLQLANVNALQSATLDLATADVGTVEFTVAGNNTYALGGLQGSRNLAFGANSLSVGGNSQSTTYSGNLSGSGLFTKVSTGTLTLSGNNTNSGGVAVDAGVLALGSAGALGSTGTISFGGGTLQYSANNTTDYSSRFSNTASQQYRIDTNGRSVTLGSALTSVGGVLTKLGGGTLTLGGANSYDGGTTVAAGRLVGTSASLQGAITNNAEVEFNVDDSQVHQYLGTMSGSGSLIKSGVGDLVLMAANSYSGGTVVTSGRLMGGTEGIQGAIANAAIVEFTMDTDGTYAGAMSGAGSLVKTGEGVLTVSGSNTFTGGVAINQGAVALGSAAALGSSGTISFGGGTLQYSSANTTDYSGRFSNAASQFYRIDTNGQSVTLGSSLTSSGGSLTKLGGGTLTVGGNNSYDGGTTINEGVLALGSANALGSAGTISFGGGTLRFSSSNTADYSSRFSADPSQQFRIDTNGQSVTLGSSLASEGGSLVKLGLGTLTVGGNNTYDGGTAIDAGTLALGSAGALGSTGTISFGGGTLQYSAGNTTDYSSRFSTANNQPFRIDTNGQNVTLASNMTSAGSASLTKLGAGTLTLGGTNLIYGPVAINEGVLAVASGGAFQTASQISFGGGTLQYASSTALLDYSSRFSTAAGQPYRIDTNGYNVSFMSALTSVGGSLTKLGAGSLQLAGTNSYNGGTTVSGGSLAGTVVALQGNIVNNAVVDFLGSTSGTYSGVMSGTGSLRTSITGELVLAGANSYSGGTVVFSNSKIRGSTGSVQGAIQNDGIVEFAQPAAGTYAGIISGTGSVIKTGAGVLQFTAANTYTGLTSVIDGGLKLNGSIGGGLNVALIASLSGTGTVGGNATIIGTHSPGNSPGAQTFNGNLTYQAGAVVNWELVANTTGSAGVNYDQIILPTGNLAFSGSTTLALSFNGAGSLVDWSSAFWDVNRSWTVYDLSGGATSSLGNLVLGGSLLDSLNQPLSPTERGYFTTSLSGQDVMLNFVAVPEPSTIALLAVGGIVAGLAARRRAPRG